MGISIKPKDSAKKAKPKTAKNLSAALAESLASNAKLKEEVAPSKNLKKAVQGHGHHGPAGGKSTVELFEPCTDEGPLAVVKGMIGGTVNVGNYSNVKAEIGFEIPCAVNAMEATYQKGLHWAMTKFQEYVKDATGK